MELNFCYIEGLSRENTIKFSNLLNQNEYFDSLQTTTVIANSFYPPYYSNRIKVSTSDVNLSTKANYLWFEYQSKRYYYFISNVSYVSEDVLEVSVYMDTIQTFMFDFKVHSGVIRRKFIDRTDSSGTINRAYIRENVSLNQHDLKVRKEFKHAQDFSLSTATDDEIEGFYILTMTPDVDSQNTYDSLFKSNGNISLTPFTYFLIPKYKLDATQITLKQGDTSLKFNARFSLDTWAKSTSCVRVCYIPNNPFYPAIYGHGGIVEVEEGQDFAIVSSTSSADFGSMPIAVNVSVLNEYQLTDIIDLGSTTEFGGSFTSDKVPALIDENYVRVFFGDNRANSTFPLHLIKEYKIYLRYYVDWDGHCYYGILESYSEPFTYNTLCVADPSMVSIVTSSYREYMDYNKWSLIGAIASTAIGIGASVLTANPVSIGGSILGGMGKVSASAYDYLLPRMPDYSSLIPPYGGSELRHTSYGRGRSHLYLPYQYGTSETSFQTSEYPISTESKTLYGLGGAIHSLSYVTNAITAIGNAYSAPDIPKGTDSEMADTASGANLIRFELSKVHDFEACAQYYHRYGYLVNEYINPTSTLFDDLDTRKYYNYVEFANLDLELSLLTFDSCVDDLKGRLTDGLRLWNVTETGQTIGDYSLDNIERSKLNG